MNRFCNCCIIGSSRLAASCASSIVEVFATIGLREVVVIRGIVGLAGMLG